MKGIWYSSNGKGCEHWHEYILKTDGTGFWAGISRCGNATALPSLIKDKFNWHAAHPEAPYIEGRYCRSCLRQKKKDEEK